MERFGYTPCDIRSLDVVAFVVPWRHIHTIVFCHWRESSLQPQEQGLQCA